jgi:hypothetical protein
MIRSASVPMKREGMRSKLRKSDAANNLISKPASFKILNGTFETFRDSFEVD